ncbi:hypothetical protein D2A57_00695 [Campylobacter coli]|nr:hypothetical protein [Campylobacter coli]EAL9625861.1 hypothetical protein [Campylobacter coli]EAM0324170.1 hypothetical protein [Campylobacter coli]EAO7201204.1 hypothetical protein [Campylobacter jejuni]EGI1656427.1 hypothetical protein [Campylobacter jejuni]
MKLKDFDFRIWDNIEKKYIKSPHGLYIENTEHNDASNCNRIIANYEQRAFYIDYPFNDRNNEYYDNEESLLIELFTGLCDKNGNKIYEGDVIKYVYIFKHELLDKGMIKNLPKKVSIGYIGIDNFLGFRILKNKELQCFMKDIANIEIIGNIHENKKLLEGE